MHLFHFVFAIKCSMSVVLIIGALVNWPPVWTFHSSCSSCWAAQVHHTAIDTLYRNGYVAFPTAHVLPVLCTLSWQPMLPCEGH